MRVLLTVAAICSAAFSAVASGLDTWGPLRLGMTELQVTIALGKCARPTPQEQQVKDAALYSLWTCETRFKDTRAEVTVDFRCDNQRLAQVRLLLDLAQLPDPDLIPARVQSLVRTLTEKYGVPIHASTGELTTEVMWKTPAQVIHLRALTTTGGFALITYRPATP